MSLGAVILLGLVSILYITQCQSSTSTPIPNNFYAFSEHNEYNDEKPASPSLANDHIYRSAHLSNYSTTKQNDHFENIASTSPIAENSSMLDKIAGGSLELHLNKELYEMNEYGLPYSKKNVKRTHGKDGLKRSHGHSGENEDHTNSEEIDEEYERLNANIEAHGRKQDRWRERYHRQRYHRDGRRRFSEEEEDNHGGLDYRKDRKRWRDDHHSRKRAYHRHRHGEKSYERDEEEEEEGEVEVEDRRGTGDDRLKHSVHRHCVPVGRRHIHRSKELSECGNKKNPEYVKVLETNGQPQKSFKNRKHFHFDLLETDEREHDYDNESVLEHRNGIKWRDQKLSKCVKVYEGPIGQGNKDYKSRKTLFVNLWECRNTLESNFTKHGGDDDDSELDHWNIRNSKERRHRGYHHLHLITKGKRRRGNKWKEENDESSGSDGENMRGKNHDGGHKHQSKNRRKHRGQENWNHIEDNSKVEHSKGSDSDECNCHDLKPYPLSERKPQTKNEDNNKCDNKRNVVKISVGDGSIKQHQKGCKSRRNLFVWMYDENIPETDYPKTNKYGERNEKAEYRNGSFQESAIQNLNNLQEVDKDNHVFNNTENTSEKNPNQKFYKVDISTEKIQTNKTSDMGDDHERSYLSTNEKDPQVVNSTPEEVS